MASSIGDEIKRILGKDTMSNDVIYHKWAANHDVPYGQMSASAKGTIRSVLQNDGRFISSERGKWRVKTDAEIATGTTSTPRTRAFGVGDTVKIKTGNGATSHISYNSGMRKYEGKITKITGVHRTTPDFTSYTLDIDHGNWEWDSSWLGHVSTPSAAPATPAAPAGAVDKVPWEEIKAGQLLRVTYGTSPASLTTSYGVVVALGNLGTTYPERAMWSRWMSTPQDAQTKFRELTDEEKRHSGHETGALTFSNYDDSSVKVVKILLEPAPSAVSAPPTPTPASPAQLARGNCQDGATTWLNEPIPNVLASRNEQEGEHWTSETPVVIKQISLRPDTGETFATIENASGEVFAIFIEFLRCFAGPAGETLGPPAAPEVAPAPAAPVEDKPEPEPAKTPHPTPPTPPQLPAAISDVHDGEYVKPLREYIGDLMAAIRKSGFVFPNSQDELVFASTWFMRDGSCVLKGAPGSGKTVLLTLTAFALSGKMWKASLAAAGNPDPTHKDVLQWLGEHDYYGMAQHNADKEPEDVFFYTRIAISEKKSEKMTAEESEAYKDVKNYTFTPTPRPIVNSFIKLQNESNRIGPNVADALLSLLSEKYVEYKGNIFPSPRLDDSKNLAGWFEATKEKDGVDPLLQIDPGHLNYFDYNPHLDVEGQEMDRALLDRIDIGIYLSAGSARMRLQIMRAKSTGQKSIPKKFFRDIKKGNVHPLNPLLIMQIWNIIDKIYVDDETLRWISFFTNIPNFTVRKYNDKSYFKYNAKTKEVVSLESYIDPTLISYKPAKEGMTAPGIQKRGGADVFDEWSAIDALERPLGSRSAESLLALIKAATFVRWCNGEVDALEFITNDWRLKDKERMEARNDTIEDIAGFLPYVLDHRVNLGVLGDIQQNFLNFGHFIQFFFVPKLLMDSDRRKDWLACMDAIDEITSTGKDERRHEFLSRLRRKLNKSEEEIAKMVLSDDPFLYQFYKMAGA